MIEILTGLITAEVATYAAGSLGTVVAAWIFKKIPNETIKKKVGGFAYGLGVAVTLGLSKWKYTKGIWNKTVEPWLIDFIDNVVVHGISRFIDGLRSDKAEKEDA